MSHTFENGRPCTGLRVLELGRGLAVSLTGMILADYGADVIRIEPPGGDPLDEQPVAKIVHRGKRSVQLELESGDRRADFHRLAETMDIVVEALTPGEAERLGVSAEPLAPPPALIRSRITGFGAAGDGHVESLHEY
jgi:crotonobetainyl-CoA:carnitine CoA-transferase CaiB-like acyl-CoA transferase